MKSKSLGPVQVVEFLSGKKTLCTSQPLDAKYVVLNENSITNQTKNN
jgi:hypothetical protein